MAIELKQQLRISQQLVMTPQLQQAIKLLQLNQIELANLVDQELQENPCLEEDERDEESSETAEDSGPVDTLTTPEPEVNAGEADEQGGAAEEVSEGVGALADPDFPGEVPASDPGGEADASEAPGELDMIADVEWDDYMESHPQTGLESRVAREEDSGRSLEANLTRAESLAGHLEWQIQLVDLTEEEFSLAEWIIGNIDDRGFLVVSVEEISSQANVGVEQVEAVLSRVQLLDPPGVGARDLAECLLIQLYQLKIEEPLVISLVKNHLDRLQKRDFRGLAKSLGVTIEEIATAARVIGGLEPRPGRAFGGDESIYITPDIYISKVGDDFHVMLNEDGLPRLRINNSYRDVLSKQSGGVESTKETRDYVQDKVRSAVWLIKSIHQRQRTICKVTESIIRHQRGFFEQGVGSLKPLNLRDVAEDIEMHESTVSRVTTNKYVQTPQGIYELKYFFNSSINRRGGDAVGSESVKERIRKIIAAEDERKPVSDQRIVEVLEESDIEIARRTVTKYREAMNILSSTKRRQLG